MASKRGRSGNYFATAAFVTADAIRVGPGATKGAHLAGAEANLVSEILPHTRLAAISGVAWCASCG